MVHTSATCLDVVFSNSSLISSVDTISCPFSDHDAVLLTLNSKCMNYSPSSVETRALNDQKLIYGAFKSTPFDALLSSSEVCDLDANDKFHLFKKLILDTMDAAAPLKQISIKKNNNLPNFDSELKFYTNERNKIHSFALNFPKTDQI